ncbi:hypothetical protein WA588_005931 [Blastocystis sp. NMH]
MRQFSANVNEFYKSQRQVENANRSLERFIYALSMSQSILTSNTEQPAKEATPPSEPAKPEPSRLPQATPTNVNNSDHSQNSSVSKSVKRTSQKRPAETPFSLERQEKNIPKKLQNPKDIGTMERILQYIATKKKDGVVLKDIVVLVNENTIRCNEYLNTLMKLGEIVRRQTKTGLVYSLQPNRYYRYLNS